MEWKAIFKKVIEKIRREAPAAFLLVVPARLRKGN